MDAKTLAKLRPADGTPVAIRAAIDAVKQERAAAEQRLVNATARRASLLLEGSTAEIRAAEESARDAETDIARLDVMAPALATQLADAVAREAGDERAEQVRAAAAAVTKFNAWFETGYPVHAAALAEGLELERQALRAREALRNPNTHTLTAELPEPARAFVGADGRGLGFLVRLPAAAAGQPAFWWPR